MDIFLENIYSHARSKDYYPLERPRNKVQILLHSQFETFFCSVLKRILAILFGIWHWKILFVWGCVSLQVVRNRKSTGHDYGEIKFSFVEVTWQEASKHKIVNNRFNSYKVTVAVFSCKRWERSESTGLKFLNQALCYVALFQQVKGEFPQEYIAYI